jgi:hypothetical protein
LRSNGRHQLSLAARLNILYYPDSHRESKSASPKPSQQTAGTASYAGSALKQDRKIGHPQAGAAKKERRKQ